MNDEIKSKVERFKLSIESYGKLKNGIKKSIIGDLIEVLRYIKNGPGVVSSEKVSKCLGEVKSLLSVWVKDTSVLKNWYEEIDYIKDSILPESNELTKAIKNEKKEAEKEFLEKREYLLTSEEVLDKPIGMDMPRRYRILFPESLEKLDVVYVPIGVIPHYCIVYKVVGDITYVVSMTSNKNKEYTGHLIEKSRFWSGSTAVFALHQIPTKLALSMYVMPFDSKIEGNTILQECTEFLTKNILIKSRRKKK